MLNYFRSDGWVKTTQGPAVPGAQVYVCTQPANVTPPITPPRTTPVPWIGPNPQAPIFSDAGLTPIAQPIITDGFGHYDFYVQPGIYTVVILFGGKVQQVYVDQSIGNIGSTGGTSLTLEVNGSPLFNQTLLNLQQGSGIVLTPDNFGNVTISTSSSFSSVQVNGSPFSSTTLIDFINTPTVSWTDAGSGHLSATANIPPLDFIPTPTTSLFVYWIPGPVGSSWVTIFDGINTGGAAHSTISATSTKAATVVYSNGLNGANGYPYFWPTRSMFLKTSIFIDNDGTDSGVRYVGFSDIPASPNDPTTAPYDSILAAVVQTAGVLGNWQLLSTVGGSTTTADSGVPAVSGSRNHIQITVQSGTATLILNGVAIASLSTLPTANAMSVTFYQQRTSGVNPNFNTEFEYIYAQTIAP